MRAKMLVFMSGAMATALSGDEQFLLSENESTFIPLGVRHRLENPGKVPLEINRGAVGRVPRRRRHRALRRYLWTL
jgi:mannose-6-phosphate isomerase-like protein (cupin superfamily)